MKSKSPNNKTAFLSKYIFRKKQTNIFFKKTTKQLFFKNAITEILWIYQAQSNDVRWLQERGVHIWDEWEVDEDGIYRIHYDYQIDKDVLAYLIDNHDAYRHSSLIHAMHYLDN